MRHNRFTKPEEMIAGLLTGLLFAILAVPLGAQPAADYRPYYDVTKEVTLSGTVSSVLTRPSPGTIAGSHLLFATDTAVVDASLGRWGLQGKGALSVVPGQQVEVTGVMKTLKGEQVFIARSVKVDGQVYTMRNEHGIPVSPQARKRASQKIAQKGGSL